VKQVSSIVPSSGWTLRRKVFIVGLCLILIFSAALARELLTPDFYECHHVPQPFAAQQSPTQAVFIARVLSKGTLWPWTTGPLREGTPRGYWAVALVQESYWGLPWWDHKIVLLTFFVRGGTGFERGETYFVDGHRWSRKLTQFLPVFETQCSRTVALKYSEIDLRALREGVPKNSVRIMGYTLQRTSADGWKKVPTVTFGISGPTGETIVTSDQQGLYDISELPPGTYFVHRTDPKAGPYWAHPICIWEGQQYLEAGDIRECPVTVR
jgi:hypothetical protein